MYGLKDFAIPCILLMACPTLSLDPALLSFRLVSRFLAVKANPSLVCFNFELLVITENLYFFPCASEICIEVIIAGISDGPKTQQNQGLCFSHTLHIMV